jgi:hypothetical protein
MVLIFILNFRLEKGARHKYGKITTVIEKI